MGTIRLVASTFLDGLDPWDLDSPYNYLIALALLM